MCPEQIFPIRLRLAREALGMTQATLARRVGITRSMINGVELGRFLPRTVLLVQLATVLEVSVDWLLGLSETPVPGAADGVSEVAVQLSPSNRAWWVALGKTLIEEERTMRENVQRWRKEA